MPRIAPIDPYKPVKLLGKIGLSLIASALHPVEAS